MSRPAEKLRAVQQRWAIRSSIASILFAIGFSAPANADPTAHCDGKYAAAAELIDAAYSKYGTLYSGGAYRKRLESVGATIDLYRFRRGLPDLKLREVNPPSWSTEDRKRFPYGWDLGHPPETYWEKSRWAVSPEAPSDPTYEALVWAGIGPNKLTSAGPAPDWWLRPEDFPKLTRRQRWVSETIASEPFLDWLQTVLAASAAPWANYWHLSGIEGSLGFFKLGEFDVYIRLAERALDRYEAGEGTEWLAASASIGAPLNRLRSEMAQVRIRIADCSASPQDYAVYAVDVAVRRPTLSGSAFLGVRLQPYLPSSVRMAAAENTLFLYALNEVPSRTRKYETPRSNVSKALAKLREFEPENTPWQQQVDMFDLITAETIDQIPISDHAYVRRAYNLLSADHLAQLARRAGEDAHLATIAFTRHVALENWSEAETLLPLLTSSGTRLPEVGNIWRQRAPRSVRLAAIAITLPSSTTHVRGSATNRDFALYLYQRHTEARRNLPSEYRFAQTLQRDFEAWLMWPSQWRAFRGMHGIQINWLQRRAARRIPPPRIDTVSLSALPVRPDDPGTNFSRLIALEEIARLTGRKRFLHTIGRTLVPWAEEQTRGRLWRTLADLTFEAETLAQFVRICRYDSCGVLDDKPAQQRAFELLHYRLGEYPAAQRTPHWWGRHD
jgi:hypothetical protein